MDGIVRVLDGFEVGPQLRTFRDGHRLLPSPDLGVIRPILLWDRASRPVKRRPANQSSLSGNKSAAGFCSRRMSALANAAPTAPSRTRWSKENDRYITSAGRICPASS